MYEHGPTLRLLMVCALTSLLCGCHPPPGEVRAPQTSTATPKRLRQHAATARVSSPPSPLGEYLYLASQAGYLRQITDAQGRVSFSAVTQTRLDQCAVNADGSVSTHAAPLILARKETGMMVAAARRRAVYLAGGVGLSENVAQFHVRLDGRLHPLGSFSIKSEDPIGKMDLDHRERYLRVRIDAACGKGRDIRYCPYSLWYRVAPSGRLVTAALKQRPRDFSPFHPGHLGFSVAPSSLGGSSVLTSRTLADGSQKPLPAQWLIGTALLGSPALAATPDGRYLFIGFTDSGRTLKDPETSWPVRVYRTGRDGRVSLVSSQATAPIGSPVLCTDPLGRFLYVVSTTGGKLYSFRILPDGHLRAVSKPLAVGHAESLVAVRVP